MKRSPMPKRTSSLRRTPFKAKPKAARVKILADGREHCYGEAWEQRKREVWHRDGCRCQYMTISGIACGPGGSWPIERRCLEIVPWEEARLNIDHIVKRSKYRDDRMANLRTLCAYHHKLRHDEERKLAWSKKESA